MNRFLSPAIVAVAMMLGATVLHADDYPSKAVDYIIPYNPGGESDVTARFQEKFWSEVTGQDVVISYKPGAGGATAWSQLGGFDADGYTIMNVNFPHAILQPSIKDVGYQTEDVVPAYVFHYTPDAIVVRADSPYETLQDLIDFATENPGALTFGGSGTNSANHLAAVRFGAMADVKVTYVPFGGSAPAMAAVLGGQIGGGMTYTTQGVKAGDQVRVLAIATEERLDIFPDVPTFKELGFDYVAGAYRGVTVPKDTPEEVRQQLSDVIASINDIPEFQAQMQENGYVLVDVPHAEMGDWIAARQADYAAGIEILQGN